MKNENKKTRKELKQGERKMNQQMREAFLYGLIAILFGMVISIFIIMEQTQMELENRIDFIYSQIECKNVKINHLSPIFEPIPCECFDTKTNSGCLAQCYNKSVESIKWKNVTQNKYVCDFK